MYTIISVLGSYKVQGSEYASQSDRIVLLPIDFALYLLPGHDAPFFCRETPNVKVRPPH